MLSLKQSRRAFTLVEISIVLVIIGLILGSVLTGQQIIENARINNTVNSIQGYEAQLQTYQQNYGVLPGDDPSATTRFPGVVPANGDGNGAIGNGDSSYATTATAGVDYESRLVWAHLRAAGLVKNQTGADGTTAIQPPNAFGGLFGFQNNAFNTGGLVGTVLCLNNVPADAAQAIDTKLDDGVANTGNIMASVGAVGAAITPPVAGTGYVAGQVYTVCVRM